MNLQDQIGALDAGVDQLIQAVSAALASCAAIAAAPEPTHAAAIAEPETPAVAAAPVHEPEPQAAQVEPAESAQPAVREAQAPTPTLEVGRPSANEITMTISGQTVSLNPMQVGQLIEELANARASMQPEPPPAIPQGWRFASTKNPMIAVQKQSNGDRLLVMRHTGHGWVPFVFSPDMIVQMYMMLTQR